jgi:hypothetical protein
VTGTGLKEVTMHWKSTRALRGGQAPIPEVPGVSGAAAAVAGLQRRAERDQQRAALAELLVDEPPPGSDTWFNEDLRSKSRSALLRERAALRRYLQLHPAPDRWYADRLVAIEEALRVR